MFEQQNYAEMADHNTTRKLPCNEPCLGNSPNYGHRPMDRASELASWQHLGTVPE